MPVSSRIEQLKNNMLSEKRYMSVEQARIIHETHQKYSNEPLVIRRAIAFAEALKKITIRIEDGELIVGNRSYGVRNGIVYPECGIVWLEKEIDNLPNRAQDPFQTRPEDVKYVKEILLPYWKDRTLESQINKKIGTIDSAISSIVKINQKGRSQGHIIPNVEEWLRLGVPGLLKKAQEKRSTEYTQEKISFYDSIIISLEGVREYYRRYANLALNYSQSRECYRDDYKEVYNNCIALSNRAPKSFHEAVQAVWMLMVCLQMESNAASISLGRLDQYLYPYFLSDLEKGEITEQIALEIIECFFLKLNQIVCMRSGEEAKYFAGFPIGFNLVIGGKDEQGALLENELSFLMLKAQKDLHLPQPNLSARLCDKSSDMFILSCAEVLADGGGIPQIFNDESIIAALKKSGLSNHDASEYGIVGCVELAGCGNMLGWSNAAMFNVVKVLELTLNHGKCLLTGCTLSPDFGGLDTYNSYEELENALKQNISYFIELMILCHNTVDEYHKMNLPTPFLSSVVDDCIDKGIDVTSGGAKYNSSGMQIVQIANLIDSLAILRDLVFTNRLSGRELLEQIRLNYPDKKLLDLVKSYCKYGNDIPEIDSLSNQWVEYIYSELCKYKNIRGGNFNLGLYTVSSHVPMGESVGATCDGRLAGMPLADGGISPSSGSDLCGPTAVLKSASKLRYDLISNGTLLNMKFSPAIFKEKESLERFCGLLKAFVKLGIHHVQFNVVDKEELLAAQKKPEDYKNLLIRVAGYTAYFVELDQKLQDEIIRRTENIL